MPHEKSQSATWKDFILISIYGPLILVQVVLVFKYYNYLNVTSLLYTGWVGLVLFFVIGYLPSRELKKRGSVSEGRSYMHTTVVVDSGIYAVVRHPQFLSWIILSGALALLSQHWLSVVCIFPVAVLVYMEALRADQSDVEKFGDDYKQYMQKVPRLNLLVGMYRVLRSRGSA